MGSIFKNPKTPNLFTNHYLGFFTSYISFAFIILFNDSLGGLNKG